MEHCNARTKAASANGAPPADPGPWTGAGYCKRPAGWGVPETTSGRCKNHGGASLKGAGHPRVTDLRSSRYVPKWLADDYEASLRRTDQLALDEQFATRWTLGSPRSSAVCQKAPGRHSGFVSGLALAPGREPIDVHAEDV